MDENVFKITVNSYTFIFRTTLFTYCIILAMTSHHASYVGSIVMTVLDSCLWCGWHIWLILKNRHQLSRLVFYLHPCSFCAFSILLFPFPVLQKYTLLKAFWSRIDYCDYLCKCHSFLDIMFIHNILLRCRKPFIWSITSVVEQHNLPECVSTYSRNISKELHPNSYDAI